MIIFNFDLSGAGVRPSWQNPIQRGEIITIIKTERVQLILRYLVLADYDPLSDRELGLRQMDLVDLLKTGCAGWWFVRLVRPPYTQGWAPSTYLQTLDEM